MSLSSLRKPLAISESGYSQELNDSANIQVGGLSASTLEITGNVDAANLLVSGLSTLSGNVAALSNLSVASSITAASATLSGALSAATGAFSGNVSVGNISSGIITGSSAALSGALSAATGSISGNVSVGNISSNIITGSSAALSGALSAATGAFSGNVSVGNISSGIITGSSAALSGALSAATGAFSGNVSVGNISSGIITGSSAALSGALSAASGSFSGTVSAGNLSTTGSLTSNVLAVSGQVTLSGNVTVGNLSTTLGALSAKTITASANISAGNLLASGLLSAATGSFSGNVSVGNISSGAVSGTSASFTSATLSGSLSGTTGSFSGNVSVGNISSNVVSGTSASFTSAALSGALTAETGAFSGNVSVGNISSNIITGSSAALSGALSAATGSFSGNVSVGNISSNVISGTVGAFSTSVTVNGIVVGTDGKISNLTDPTADQDAATKKYVDGVAAGLDIKPSVKTISSSLITLSGTQTVNGVALTAGMRILVAGQGGGVTTPDTANGIYIVAAGAWSRSSDMAAGSDAAGAFTFVEQGTLYADAGWVCVTDTAVVGTNALRFTQFSSAGVIEAGAGLLKTGNTIDVIVDDGIKIDGSNKVAVNLASSSGLEFSSKALIIKLADNSLQLGAGGLSVKLSGSTLDETASGLEVLGVPTLFTVAGTATAAHVTAANLGVYSSGVASVGGDASALHFHNMVESMDFSAHSSGLTKGDPVYVSSSFEAKKATAAVADGDGMVFGVAVANVAGGNTSRVICSGVALGVLTGLSGTGAGFKVYLGDSGGLTTNIATISAGKRLILMGVCINSNDLFVQVRDYGQKAS